VVGRDWELEFMGGFLRDASEAGGALLLLGELGVGKTALLQATGQLAETFGYRVVRTSGAEFEADVNYSGLNQALLALSDNLASLNAVHKEALSVALGLGKGEPPDRLLVSNATLALFTRIADEQPLLIIADDAHWLDRSSAWVFAFLARRVEGIRVAFVGATRPGAESFFEGAGLEELEIKPLSDAAARQLLSSLYPDLAPSVQERLVVESQGNPLALMELPVALTDHQRAERIPLPTALPLSRRLNAVFSGRISALPPSCKRLLRLCALEGTGELSVLQRADDDHVLDKLAPAERENLIALSFPGLTVEFRHPLVRTAIIRLSTRQELVDTHRELATLFADSPDRRARHLAEATLEPDEPVAAFLEGAARAMQARGDPRGAAPMLMRAADLSPADTDKGRRLSAAAFMGASTALHDVADLLEQARRADPSLDTSLPFASAAAFMMINGEGEVETAHRLMESAINSQIGTVSNDADDLVQAMGLFGFLCYVGQLPSMWQAFEATLARLGPDVGDELFLMSPVFSDPLRATEPMLQRLNGAINRLRNESDQRRIVNISGYAASVNRLAGCRDALWRVVAEGRRGQAPTQTVSALTMLCSDGFQSGRWDEVEGLATEGLELCKAHTYATGEWVLRYHLATVAAGRGDHESVRQLTESINTWAAPGGIRQALSASNHARELDALGDGNFEYAYQLASAISPAGTLRPYSLHALWSAMDLVEAALRTNRDVEAQAHVETMRLAHMERVSSRLSLLARGAAAMVHSGEDATALYVEALNGHGATRWVFDYARVQLAFGEHLRRSRANVGARPHLEAALETFERLGAHPWAHRASGELRATGQSRSAGGHAASADLTPQEREIALLAASGLTNKEIGTRLFMSHRTVGSHLYHVYPKLGITSRTELRDALAGLDLEESESTSRY
jgi:DNA-binding CsgD family transcriptional regulator